MNRYSFVMGKPEDVAKDTANRKVSRVKKAMVKKLGKNSVKERGMPRPRPVSDRDVDAMTTREMLRGIPTVPNPVLPRPRRAPRLTTRKRNQNCHLCGFHIEEDQPEYQSLCNRCDAELRRREKGVSEGWSGFHTAVMLVLVPFLFMAMWVMVSK